MLPGAALAAQPAPDAAQAVDVTAAPIAQPVAPAATPTGGRRIKRDPNRPIGTNDTVEYESPENPGVPIRCTVLGVYPGAYKVQCRDLGYINQIVRDIDVKRPGGPALEVSTVGAVTAPFKANDLVLVTPTGLQDERYWTLCIVIRNTVTSANSYVVDCGNGALNALPAWVRADPDFQ